MPTSALHVDHPQLVRPGGDERPLTRSLRPLGLGAVPKDDEHQHPGSPNQRALRRIQADQLPNHASG